MIHLHTIIKLCNGFIITLLYGMVFRSHCDSINSGSERDFRSQSSSLSDEGLTAVLSAIIPMLFVVVTVVCICGITVYVVKCHRLYANTREDTAPCNNTPCNSRMSSCSVTDAEPPPYSSVETLENPHTEEPPQYTSLALSFSQNQVDTNPKSP